MPAAGGAYAGKTKGVVIKNRGVAVKGVGVVIKMKAVAEIYVKIAIKEAIIFVRIRHRDTGFFAQRRREFAARSFQAVGVAMPPTAKLIEGGKM